jgi:signal transduction histidine kinase
MGDATPVGGESAADAAAALAGEAPLAEPQAAVLDALPANVALLDRAGRIVFVNRAWREFASANGFIGEGAGVGADYVAVCRGAAGDGAKDAQAIARALTALLAGRRRHFEREYPCHPPGGFRWFRFLAASLAPPHPIGAVLMHFDVTQRRLAEEERRFLERRRQHISKVEALGTFAGGIAHDFNNLLLGMAGLLDAAIAELPAEQPAVARLRSVRAAVEQAGQLVQQVLAFARQEAPRREPIDLAATIDRALDLVAAGLPGAIDLRRTLAPGLIVAGDSVQLQQVIMNLSANAVDALEKRPGTIDVALDRIEGAAELSRVGLKGSPHARLTFRDTGAGMPEAVRARIFEPFFTTKEVGKGTGMGLAVVHGIVTAHGGAAIVESAPDAGTIFTVYLPLAEA